MIDTAALKTKVLDLACQGKLTKQFIEDGSTSDLLDDISTARKKLEEAGIYKNKKKMTIKKIGEDDKPETIPANWKWVRLGTVCDIYGRIGFRGYTKADIVEEGKGAISMSPSNVTVSGKIVFDNNTYITWEKYNESPEIMLEPGDIIIVKTGSSYGKSGLIEDMPEKATINPQLAILKNILCNRQYLNWCLKCSDSWKQYNNFVIGAATPTFSQEKLANLLIPMPPLAEQDRIVEVLNEIDVTVDSIEKLQQQYASDLNVLRSKIIDAGIKGKLTEQLPEDGTAESLYNEIQNEKTRMIKEKTIKKEKALAEISDDEIPFELPKSWMWVRLGDICSKISSGNTPAGGAKGGAYVDEGYCFFREQNIYNDGIHEEGMVYISEELLDSRPNSTVLPKDILLNITGGSIGRCALVPEDFTRGSINQHILIIRTVDTRLRFYVHKCLCSPYYQKLIMGNVVGDKDGFSAGRCKNTLIPLPPLKEQERIVERIDGLLAAIG